MCSLGLDWESLPPLRDIIRAHGLRAEKKLGQNFLLDQNITDKITRHIDGIADSVVFEIGPGPGGLTRSLLKAGAGQVIAVEYDERAIKALQGLQDFSEGRLKLIHGDALETDLKTLCNDAPCHIAANLPYNIATPLLVNWLRQIHHNVSSYKSMTLMFQHEVAERIVAQPGTKAYGRLAVLAQWLCDVEILFTLPPQAFTPPPKVKSSVVRFIPKKLSSDQPDFAVVERITAAAFGQRRKMVRSSLKDYTTLFEVCGIDPARRAEEIKVSQYIDLAKNYS